MNSILEPDQNWKQAAAQEGVDYDAVLKSFMDQSYGLVANKAKVLFQDPFRLGFEVVHRNEKATKMVGFFAFRVNGAILYAPVFFLNGEIKPADMLYRGDVKRFVPLTDEWCTFLVRGANQEAGMGVEKSRQRQPDAYMDRLAYPHRVKYATNAGEVFNEIMAKCAEDDPFVPVLPRVIADIGPSALEKLAALIENSDTAKRFVATNYTQEQLFCLDGWQEKAAAAPADPEENAIVLVNDLTMVKSASEHAEIVRRGYALVDNRPEKSAAVTEEIEDLTCYELRQPGAVNVMKDDGDTVPGVILRSTDVDFSTPEERRNIPSTIGESQMYLYVTGDKQVKEFVNGLHEVPLFGQPDTSVEVDKLGKSLSEVSSGDTILFFHPASMRATDPVRVTDVRTDGDSRVLVLAHRWGGSCGHVTYATGRETSGRFYGDDIRALPVDTDAASDDDSDAFTLKWGVSLMSPQSMDKWMRTAGGITTSKDVTIRTSNKGLSFDIEHSDENGKTKVARDLGMLEAHLMLANDFSLRCDQAGKLLDKTVDDSLSRIRIFDTQKSAYMTTAEQPLPWLTGFDPELNVKTDTPQRQILRTFTPRRAEQTSRYGDTWQRPKADIDDEVDKLPDDALLSRSPEELATMASQYGLPQIFDHGVMAQLAKSNFNTIAQVQQYIPDLETGVDRYFRILFLLRYRPADFEEAYGKDELMEMEQELSELASLSGENLLRLLKRFDTSKFSRQGA